MSILAWAYESMMATYNYNFTQANAETIKKNAEQYYTKAAWDNYDSQLSNSDILDKIKKKKLIASVGVDPAPLILNKGEHTWKIQLPLIIHYQSASEHISQKQMTTLDIIYNDQCQLKISKMTTQ